MIATISYRLIQQRQYCIIDPQTCLAMSEKINTFFLNSIFKIFFVILEITIPLFSNINFPNPKFHKVKKQFTLPVQSPKIGHP